ncbi:MAG TPA: YbaK/EbsC family protein [Acidimicrobiales bacterium]|nr:YbaK/EbsC family protein [Acidimicrobiales bacterium]
MLHRNAQRVVEAAAALGFAMDVREFPDGTRTADDAARAIGVEVGQIVKSLVFLADGSPVVALVSGSNQLDEAKLAVAAGASSTGRATAEQVREATGFPVGGVPPLGHATALPLFVDEDLLTYEEVWAAAGTPHLNFAITPDELVRITGGKVCALARC